MKRLLRKIGRGVNQIISKLDPEREFKNELDIAHKEIMDDLNNFLEANRRRMDRETEKTIERLENIVKNQN